MARCEKEAVTQDAPQIQMTRGSRNAVMGAVLLGLFLAALDQTVVGTALPRIVTDLHGNGLYTWVVTSYLLSSTITVPIYGKLSDVYGRKILLIIGIVIFLVGSLLSGLSQDITWLIIFRGVQGLGAGALFPIALANMALHGIDAPNLWHGNTLSLLAQYDGLWTQAPALFDVVLTNPPFGGQENADVQTRFAYRTSATQILFLQHVIDSLAHGGRCGMVVDEGVMFRTNENAFVQTKRKLLDSCDLWCVVSLPAGTFSATGAGVKTNLLFFTRGRRTERTWYYDLSGIKVTKKRPLTLASFEGFFAKLPGREDSELSWTVERAAIEAAGYDLKAVNPNRRHVTDERTPLEIVGDRIDVRPESRQDAVHATPFRRRRSTRQPEQPAWAEGVPARSTANGTGGSTTDGSSTTASQTTIGRPRRWGA